MFFKNDRFPASGVMNRLRTGFYGDEDICGGEEKYVYRCPICDAGSPEVFFINDNDECVGCSECVMLSETP